MKTPSKLFVSLIVAFPFCASASANDLSFGFMYHNVSRHVKISNINNPYGAGSFSAEFNVNNSRYGIFDSSGVLMAAIGGAANQDMARRKAIEGAYIPKGQTSTTVEYSWVQPQPVAGGITYVAKYGASAPASASYGVSGDWDNFWAKPSGGASMDGFDVGVAGPAYAGFASYGVIIAPVWEINVHNYQFSQYKSGTSKEFFIADPLYLNVYYQNERFPWVAAKAHVSWSPLFGLMGATFGGVSQMYGYGFGAMAPIGPLTFEATYDKFNGSIIGGKKGTPIETGTWFIGARLDVVKTFTLLTSNK